MAEVYLEKSNDGTGGGHVRFDIANLIHPEIPENAITVGADDDSALLAESVTKAGFP